MGSSVLFSVTMAVSQIDRVSRPIMAMAKAVTASTHFINTIDEEFMDTSGLKAPEVQVNADIAFKHVSFAYPSRPNVQILQNLT
jgi:ATP-binding cassette subfamily B (MDR/TAP) protein 1